MTPGDIIDLHAIPEWQKIVVLPLLGVVAKHLWDRYRARLAPLRWTATYQAMAFATDDLGWGKVELLYDGSPAQNLHMIYVQIQNASSRDLSNLRVDLVANDGTIVLRSAGSLRGGTNAFLFATEYSNALQLSAAGTLTSIDRANWLRRTSFVVPFLNRGTTADFKLLVARFDYATPSVSIAIEHGGVKVLHQPPAKEVWGVREGPAISVGIVVSLLVSYAAMHFGVRTALLVGFAWLVGAGAQLVGAGTVRLWRLLAGLIE